MAQRVRLTWDRNQDKETEFYRVYRSDKPNIGPNNRAEHLVSQMDHPIDTNPITVFNEEPERISDHTFLLDHKNILLEHGSEHYPFIVRMNEVIVTNFTLDIIEGRILFDDPVDGEDKITIDEYTFDGVQIWDYDLEEEGKTYYGPEGKDLSAPTPPKNVSLEPDYDKNRIIIRFDQSYPEGKIFYYRIDAATSRHHQSGLSEWRTAKLEEPLADRPYIIERSLDGIEWKQISRTRGTIFYEYMMDRHAPDPIKNLTASTFLYLQSSLAQVTLSWDPVIDTVTSDSPLYRIRSVNKIGAISNPSDIVGPIPFQVGLKEIVIRRKVNDGTLPTFEGGDAENVGVISPEKTTFQEDVEDNEEYVYGLWVIDYAGNRSPLTYIKVTIGDATAPPPISILSIDEFQLTVG